MELFIVYWKNEVYLARAKDHTDARAKVSAYTGYCVEDLTVIDAVIPSGDVMLVRSM